MKQVSATKVVVQFTGFFAVSDALGASLCPRGQKHAGVLAYLLFNAGKPVTRDRLIDLFWSNRALKQGQDSLRQAIYAIKTSLGPHADTLISFGRKSIIAAPEGMTSDLTTSPDGIAWNTSGAFLENLSGASPVFEEWVLQTDREITNRQLSAAERRLGSLDPDAQPQEVLDCTGAILRLDPYNEPVARTAMGIYAKQGRVGHARRVYEQLRDTLREDDLQISEATSTLMDRIGDLKVGAAETLQKTAAPPPSGDRGVPQLQLVFVPERGGDPLGEHIAQQFVDMFSARLVQLPEIRLLSGAEAAGRPHFTLQASQGATKEACQIKLRLIAPDQQMIWIEPVDLPRDADAEQIQVGTDRALMRMLPPLTEHIFLGITGEPTTAFGNYLFSKRNFLTVPGSNYIEKVLHYLHRAVEIDPEFLPPYSDLIMHYNTGMFMSAPGTDLSEARGKAFELAQRLLFLNSQYANGHIGMAWCLLWRGKYDAAERSIRHAMDLSPYDPHRLSIIGTALVYLGYHDEGGRYYEMAGRRLQHDFDFLRTDYGELYFLMRDYEKALSWMEMPEIRAPYKTYFFRAPAHALLGDMRAAQADVDAFIEDIEKRWAGPEPFVPEAGFQWYCDLLPLRRAADRETLQMGFDALGVDVSVRGPS